MCYCAYVINELNEGSQKNRRKNIQKLKTIAEQIPSHIGNDTWENIHVKWEDIGSLWNNEAEIKKENVLEKTLPDKKNKSNRIDRKIVLTASAQGVNILLHENPNDLNKFGDIKNITFIDLLTVKNIEDFKKILKPLI